MTQDNRPARDPRVFPKPGDVLREGESTIEVLGRNGSRVTWKHTGPGLLKASTTPLETFEWLVKDTEVIHAAE